MSAIAQISNQNLKAQSVIGTEAHGIPLVRLRRSNVSCDHSCEM